MSPLEARMIVGIGTDLLDVGRMARELAREGAGFRDDVFTPSEVAYCESMAHPARHFAARFAAKEACWKALGGAGAAGVSLRDVEVERPAGGRPGLLLAGRAKAMAEALGVTRAHVTLTHTSTLASASVLLEGGTPGERRAG
jgi:holo-[acyl-carrier protein] synthase